MRLSILYSEGSTVNQENGNESIIDAKFLHIVFVIIDESIPSGVLVIDILCMVFVTACFY